MVVYYLIAAKVSIAMMTVIIVDDERSEKYGRTFEQV